MAKLTHEEQNDDLAKRLHDQARELFFGQPSTPNYMPVMDNHGGIVYLTPEQEAEREDGTVAVRAVNRDVVEALYSAPIGVHISTPMEDNPGESYAWEAPSVSNTPPGPELGVSDRYEAPEEVFAKPSNKWKARAKRLNRELQGSRSLFLNEARKRNEAVAEKALLVAQLAQAEHVYAMAAADINTLRDVNSRNVADLEEAYGRLAQHQKFSDGALKRAARTDIMHRLIIILLMCILAALISGWPKLSVYLT